MNGLQGVEPTLRLTGVVEMRVVKHVLLQLRVDLEEDGELLGEQCHGSLSTTNCH